MTWRHAIRSGTHTVASSASGGSGLVAWASGISVTRRGTGRPTTVSRNANRAGKRPEGKGKARDRGRQTRAEMAHLSRGGGDEHERGTSTGPERRALTMGIEELKARHGPPPWAARLVRNDRYVVTVICQAPGHQNDWHYHLAEDLVIYEGELSWTLEGRTSRSTSRPASASSPRPIPSISSRSTGSSRRSGSRSVTPTSTTGTSGPTHPPPRPALR